MSNTISFEDARQAGIILPSHYFVTTAPKNRQVNLSGRETGSEGTQEFTLDAGESHLWQMNAEFKLLGETTKKELTLCDVDGFMCGTDAMNRLIRELYDMPNVFEMSKACAYQKRTISSLIPKRHINS